MTKFAVFSFLLIPALAATAKAQGTAEEALEIQAKVISARQSIKQGSIVVSIEDRVPESPPWKYICEFDGPKLRCDRKVSRAGEAFTEKLVLTATEFLFHSDRISTKGNRLAIIKGDSDRIENYQAHIIPPRLIGMVACKIDTLHAMSINEMLGREDYEHISIEEDSIEGDLCQKVAFKTKDGITIRLWIAEEKGPSLVRAEGEYSYNGQQLLDRVDIAVKQHPYRNRYAWFPNMVNYVRTVDDTVRIHQTATVQVISLGEKIDNARFTLSTMDLPPGSSIVERTKNPGSAKMWDGNKVAVRRSPFGEIPRESKSRTRLLLIATNLAAIGCLLIYWWWQKKK